jgi:Uma2 family endonuclease
VYPFGVRSIAMPEADWPIPSRATIEEWLAIPEEKGAELLDGRIVYHASYGLKHGFTKGQLVTHLSPYNRRIGGPGGGGAAAPGGWWISMTVDMLIGGVGCRPDVIGWRRDKNPRVPEPDKRGVVTVAPDFICEVLSSSTARYDQGAKRDAYFHAGVPHYWLVDPIHKTLTVLERTERGYLIALVAGPGDLVRAAPFDVVEIPVTELFMDEQDGPPPDGETIEEGP